MLPKLVQRHLVQATRVTSARPAWWSGIRAAIATIGPILIGQSLAWPAAAWMGLAGFNVALADKGGPLRTRLSAMSVAAFWGIVAAVTGALIGRSLWISVAVVAVWALGAGLARAYGAVATTAGIISLVTLVVSIAAPAENLQGVWQRGGAVLAGSAFAMALALFVWRVRPYRAVRMAVARALRAAAAVAASPGEDSARAGAQAAIEEARGALAAFRRGMQGETPRGERLLVLAESADRLVSLLTGPPQPGVAAALEAIAGAVESERLEGFANVAVPSGPVGAVLTVALTAVRELNDDSIVAASEPSRPFFDPLLAVLAWESDVLRHALRVAVATAFAVALTSALEISRGYWLSLTVIVILQPYTSATFQKGLQRIAGTIAGGVAAAVLLAVVHSPAGLMVLIFVGAAVTVAFLPVNYGLYSLFVTITFVLLAEVGANDWHLVWRRVSMTLAGAAIAYVAAWLLWPASERGRVRDDLAEALRALADYARCLADCDDAGAAESRRAFLVALQNSEASLQRLLSDATEPHEEQMMAVVVYLRRFAIALSALAARASDRLRLGPLARYLATALADAATAVHYGIAPAPLPDDDAAREVEGFERPLNLLASLHRTLQ
jgi:uncharacterized membrane protein YccC